MGGRPTKLTPELQARICEAIRAGNYVHIAANFGGIDETTYHRWRARGAREKRGPYRAFHLAMKKAERDAEVALVAIWRKHALKCWQAAASLLERRYPQRWARHQVVEARVEEELRVALERLRAVLDAPSFQKAIEALATANARERDPSGVGDGS